MRAREQRGVLTVGHSNHPLETFLALLRRHHVTVVADVRSAPYSRFNPQFNRKALGASLEATGIGYVFMGGALGGRPDDPSCYEEGRVRYDRLARTALYREGLARTALYREGLERIAADAGRERIALMCAEKEPLDCHRTILVGRSLAERGVWPSSNWPAVAHILADGALEPHDETMSRLLERAGLPGEDLLQSREQLIAEALAHREGHFVFLLVRVAAGRRGESPTRPGPPGRADSSGTTQPAPPAESLAGSGAGSYCLRVSGCSSMAEQKLPKLTTRVRFPSPAPYRARPA